MSEAKGKGRPAIESSRFFCPHQSRERSKKILSYRYLVPTTMSSENIHDLLCEMEMACHRTLYEDIALGRSRKTTTDRSSHNQESADEDVVPSKTQTQQNKRRRTAPRLNRTWEELVSAASKQLAFMTEKEHGQVSKLASIYLLGFLLPHSTGHEFFLLQNASNKYHRSWRKSSDSADTLTFESSNKLMLQMPLSERLDNACRKFDAGEYGEMDTIAPTDFDLALTSFIEKGLSAFLSRRPMHAYETDIIHLLAAAIHPEPSDQFVLRSITRLEEGNSMNWINTRDLMTKLANQNFHVNYAVRLKLVQATSTLFVSGDCKGDTAMSCALIHLRAALHAFALNALSSYDSHCAKCGVIAITVQSGDAELFDQEWNSLLHHMVDDQSECNCPPATEFPSSPRSCSFLTRSRHTFCPHAARGELLERLLTNYHRSPKYCTDSTLVRKCLASLTDAVEWQLDRWTKSDDEAASVDSPCMLASLLYIARHLFYFLKSLDRNGESDNSSKEKKNGTDLLFKCSAQLLHHSDKKIATEASALLASVITNDKSHDWKRDAGMLLQCAKKAISNHISADSVSMTTEKALSVETLLSAASRKSFAFADSALAFLLSLSRGLHGERLEVVARAIAIVASASPSSSMKHARDIESLLQTEQCDSCAKNHVVSSLLASQLARCGTKEDRGPLRNAALSVAKQNGWTAYKMARHAMVTGNFQYAHLIYQNLTTCPLSEDSLVWVSAMKDFAHAEALLSSEGSLAVADASTDLSSSVSQFLSLGSCRTSSMPDFQFQIDILQLRVDFLDLICVLNQAACEMRLTGLHPKKGTRTALHLVKAVKHLRNQSKSYHSMYKEYGLRICRQSCSSLKLLAVLSQFIARFASKIFSECFADLSVLDTDVNFDFHVSLQDGSHPLGILIRKLEVDCIHALESPVDSAVRATLMSEVVESILKTPYPLPRSFFVTQGRYQHVFNVCFDLDSTESEEHASKHQKERCSYLTEVSTATGFAVCASGNLDVSRGNTPFSLVVLRCKVKYERALVEEGSMPTGENVESEKPSQINDKTYLVLSGVQEKVSHVSPEGNFFAKIECPPLLEEGLYLVEVRLGCQDVSGTNWLFQVEPRHLRIRVKK